MDRVVKVAGGLSAALVSSMAWAGLAAPTPVPAPGVLGLVAIGAAAIGVVVSRNKKK